MLVPPEFGWRATLIASDYLIGDHGSVTTYGAVLGIPTLLGSFPAREVAPGSLVDVVGSRAPRWPSTSRSALGWLRPNGPPPRSPT
ncbi:hypothetical protein [Saccharopolyspora gregorii]|uniref:Uncharacterized protein n=1 Tax=Saccharopolyspora gregorii TaxID=33914 RepID=A0ABP6RKF8_9PSEU